MIISRLITAIRNQTPAKVLSLPELIGAFGLGNSSGQNVTAETSKNISTAYRCGNILSDDYAKMPLQTFTARSPGQIERLKKLCPGKVITYGIDRNSQVMARNIKFNYPSTEFLLKTGRASVLIKTRLIGRHNVYNILAVITWALMITM